MSGPPAFQATPHAFQDNAFQAGVQLVAANYSLGPPTYATPALSFNYHLSASSYSLGPPVYATPVLSAFSNLVPLHANNYSLGAPTYGTATLRASQKLTALSFSVGPPTYATPAIKQVHRLAANSMNVLPPVYATPLLIPNWTLSANSYSLGPPSYATPPVILTTHVVPVGPHYSLGPPSYGFPRLTVTFAVQLFPMTELSQIEDAAAMLQRMLDILLSGIPSQPITDERNTVRRLISTLRGNAEEAIRGDELGTQLEQIFLAADAARANYIGVENVRLFLMTQVASKSFYTQFFFRSALIMTLALQSKIVSRIQFKTQAQIRNMILHMRDAFDEARAIGIDEVDVLVYQAINTMSGALINHLALTELQLPRFLTYETAFPMPSLYLANRIYQDTTRADEIEKENGVVHPAFMPRRLRVLSDAGIPLAETFLRPRPPRVT